MKLNQKQKDFLTLSGIIAGSVAFVFIGMFFFRADYKMLGMIFDGLMNGKGISISRVLGISAWMIALLIMIIGLQARSNINHRKKQSGGRW